MARPKKLHTLIAETLASEAENAARQVLANAVLARLAEQGVPVEGFPIDDFVDRLKSGRDMDGFAWPEGTPDTDLSVAFTAEEEAAMNEEIDRLVSTGKDREAFAELMELSARTVLKEVMKSFREFKADDDADLYGFRQRLDLRWGKALDLYRLLLSISQELLSEMTTALRRSKAKRHWQLRDAMLGIHARALRTGRAVLVLLQHGMADEAYARWRTLYELSVVASFISEHGDEAAAMYRAHEVVSNKARIDNSIEWDEPLGTEEQRTDITGDYEHLVQKYGASFESPYGWASPFLEGKQNPRFVDIELAIQGRRIAPPYKESSFQIHSGRAGLLGLGSLDESVINTGHSNAGLEIPLMHSSLAVMQITTAALFQNPARDFVVIKMLMLLDEKIHVEAKKAAQRLEKDHKKWDA